MIERVHFDNFKSLADLTLELGRFTALVGSNGCGKSSVLQGMHLLSQTGIPVAGERERPIVVSRFSSIYSGPRAPERLIYRQRDGEMTLVMKHIDGDELRVAIRVHHPPPGMVPLPLRVEVHVGPDAPLRCQVPPTSLPASEAWDNVFATLDHDRVQKFARAAYLQLDASAMKRTTVQDEEVPGMAFDGSGLASVLAWMKGAAEDDLAQITVDLGQIVPGIKRIKTFRERVTTRQMEQISIDGQPVWRPVDRSQLGDRFSIEFDDGSEVPADLLSEGTVLTLGLLTKLRERTRPRLLLFDSIARGLHLTAQAKLVQVLRRLLELDPALQIVCTTHSPYLLDLFEAVEVRILALDAERRTHARPLVEHPDFKKWKFGTQTGELWAALGEDWVISGAAG